MSVGSNKVNVTYGTYTFPSIGTPYVTRTQEVVYYGNKWCQLTRINLQGDLLGTYNEITAARNALIAGFSSDFQDLKIIEDGQTIASFPKCVVQSIDADSFNYGRQSYTVSLDCYEEDTFKSTYGILDPVDTYDYSEGEDGFVTIARTVSARAIRTGNPAALAQALSYVDARTGFNSVTIAPKFIGGVNASNAILTDVSRNIDRVNSSYSVSETYQVQTGDIYGVSAVPNYLTSIDANFTSGFDQDYASVNITYNIQGDKHVSPATLRAQIPSTGTLYTIANTTYGSVGLSQRPRNYSVDDNALTSKSISLKCDFTDNSFDDIDDSYFDFTSNISKDNITDATTVTINGNFKAIGPVREKYKTVSGYYYDNILAKKDGATGYLYDLAKQVYDGCGGAFTLNRLPESLSTSDDVIEGTVSLQGRFTDEDRLNSNSASKVQFNNANYNISITPSINTYAARPSCNKNGLYGVYNLNSATREIVTTNGSFGPTGSNYDTEVSNFIDTLRTNFVSTDDIKVTDETLGEVPDPYFTVEFNYGYNSKAQGGPLV